MKSVCLKSMYTIPFQLNWPSNYMYAVHGKEYCFGAHYFPTSGVYEVEPRNCPGFIYRCSISLGHINMPPSDFRLFIEHMASEYHGDTYHLISKNCNHFTSDVAFRLTGKTIPGWVNRLARLGKQIFQFRNRLLCFINLVCRILCKLILHNDWIGTLR